MVAVVAVALSIVLGVGRAHGAVQPAVAVHVGLVVSVAQVSCRRCAAQWAGRVGRRLGGEVRP